MPSILSNTRPDIEKPYPLGTGYVLESIILQELANKKQVINDEMYQMVDFK